MRELLIAAAGFLAGSMNAVAGGGSFVTLPALVFAGLPALAANATSTVALFPGSFASALAYRDDFQRAEGLSVRRLLPASLAGGLIGALLLLTTPVRTFDRLLPWLFLLGTLAFAFGRQAGARLRRYVHLGRCDRPPDGRCRRAWGSRARGRIPHASHLAQHAPRD